MKDLKIALFEDTFYYGQRWQELKRELGEYDSLVGIQHTKFCTCYSLIERCGLDDEYQEWKAGKVNEQ